MKISRILAITILLGLSACSRGTDPIQPPPPVPLTPQQVDASLEIGSGVISPYKTLGWQNDPGRILIITGRGESFGDSSIHVVDSASLAELAAPIAVGRNASDVIWVGDRILVSSRSSSELFLIDPDSWTLLDSVSLQFPPLSLVAIDATHAVVSSAGGDGTLLRVDVTGGSLTIDGSRTLADFARDLSFDSSSGRLYAIGPRLGIETMDAMTLASIGNIPVPTTLSFSSLIWNGFLVASDRDGYLHFLDLQSQQLTTVDLADSLNLNRANLALRGIDPLDLILIDDNHFAVHNQRQNSVVFEFVAGQSPPVQPVAEYRSGRYGMYLPQSNEILSAQTPRDVVVRIQLPADFALGITDSETQVGTRIVDAVALNGSSLGLIAVLDLDRTITVVDSSGTLVGEFSPAAGESWGAPLAAGPAGTILATQPSGNASVLWQFDTTGTQRDQIGLVIAPVFSVRASEETILATDRLGERVEIVDVASGSSTVVKLSRTRPRHAVPLAGGLAFVVHDTNPDIGVTLLRNGVEQSFQGLELSRWWSDAALRGDDIVASTFAGGIGVFNSNATLVASLLINFPGVKHVISGADDVTWIVSEDIGAALSVSMDERRVVRRVDSSGLFKLFEIEPGRVWMVGLRNLQTVSLDP